MILTLEKPRELKQTSRQIRDLMAVRAMSMPLVEGEGEVWSLSADRNRAGIQWLFRKLGWRWQHVSASVLREEKGVEAITLSSVASEPGQADHWEASLVYVGDESFVGFRCPLLNVDVTCAPVGAMPVVARDGTCEGAETVLRLLLLRETVWLKVKTPDREILLELGHCRPG